MPSIPPSSLTLDDVFSSNTSSVVDADVIEAVKENIQPLQKGRRATALSAIFSTPLAQRDALLSRQRSRFRLLITQALEDNDDEEDVDPLDVYSRFVTWTLESYPQGQSAESGLLELLEEATRKLKDVNRYKQDPRYLQLWALYAGYVEKPSIIYSYLLANEIGTNLAQLYEEYAYVHERDGMRREANEMYSLGIARKAEPLGHLKKRYADFQRRMIAAPLPAPPSPSPSPSPSRTIAPPTAGRRTVLGISSTSRPPLPNTTSTADAFSSFPRSNARLQIFVDPAGEATQRAEGNDWVDVGTRTSRIKENIVETHRMGDGPLSRSRSTQRSVSGSASRATPLGDPRARGPFIIFRDEDDTTARPPPLAPTQSRRIASTSKLEPFQNQTPATPSPASTPNTGEGREFTLSDLFNLAYPSQAAERTPARVTIPSTPMSLAPRAKQGVLTSETEALRKDPFKNYDVHPEDI